MIHFGGQGKQFLDSLLTIEYVYIKKEKEMKIKIINFITVLMENKFESGKNVLKYTTLY